MLGSMDIKSRFIKCPQCSQRAPLKIEKIFDDTFNPIGEKKICAFCKTEFKENEIEYAPAKTPKIFDPSAERKICQYCRHYVMNPWTQKCMVWNKEVTATDSCEKFEKKKIL